MERWNVAESYSNPVRIYEKAREAGMSLVTITDHNSIEGSLILKERFGDQAFTGLECTALFPEDKCKIHVLIYGIDEREFREIQSLRKDIYELRDYIREKGLAYSVAHATYSTQPGKLTVAHIERLIILFNVFEVINGGRNRSDNAAWRHILENLSPDCIEALCRKHALEPFDDEPWIKGFTAGSDDHGGIFIGQTYTEAKGSTGDDLLAALKRKETSFGGRHSDYQSLAFSVYKVLHDRARQSENGSSSLLGQLADALFDGKKMGFGNRLRIRRSPLRRLARSLTNREFANMEDAVGAVYSDIAEFSDKFLKLLFTAMGKDMADLDLLSVARNAQASMPGLLLLLPFFMTLRHLNQNRVLVDRLASGLGIDKARGERRILWFTDTLVDLNGVSATLQEVSRFADLRGLDVRIVTSQPEEQIKDLPPNVLNLPYIHEFDLPYYESYRLRVPSVLRSLKEMYQFDPDLVHISTPGPVGLLGLLVAKLMNLKSVGFYHTDFSLQAKEIVEDQSVADILESYTHWFYSATDEIRVPSRHYVSLLEARGFDPGKMSLFTPVGWEGVPEGIFEPTIFAEPDSEKKIA